MTDLAPLTKAELDELERDLLPAPGMVTLHKDDVRQLCAMAQRSLAAPQPDPVKSALVEALTLLHDEIEDTGEHGEGIYTPSCPVCRAMTRAKEVLALSAEPTP